MINYISKERKPRKIKINNKISKIMAKYEYINRKVIAGTMEFLQEFKQKHPETLTPMRDACEHVAKSDRNRFVRAAKQLGWAVCVSRGKVYENGVLCW